MKIKVETVFETSTGQYEMKFFNLTNSEESMDYGVIKSMLDKIFKNFTSQIDDQQESDLPAGFRQDVH